MQTALTLLIMAMSLLTQVHNSPNVSPEFVAQAENIANQAITYAQGIINEQTTQTTVVAQTPTETPITFGSIVPRCIENPILTLSTTTDLTISDRYVVHVIYSTGCDLKSDTPFSYYADSWRTNSGTIGDYRNNGNWEYTVNAIPNYDSFTMTVGTTTKNF